MQAVNKLEFLLANINAKACNRNIGELVITNDILRIIGYRTLNKSLILKLGTNDDLSEYYSKES